jgi:hypothetical protein
VKVSVAEVKAYQMKLATILAIVAAGSNPALAKFLTRDATLAFSN